MTRTVLVIHNPSAGGTRRALLDGVLRALRRTDCAVELAETGGRGDARRLCTEASGFDCVAIAGGDGTLNEAINGLRALEDAPTVALIPVGTSNVMAAEIGLARDPAVIARTILEGNSVPVSLGRVNGHYFSVMAGAGFDAHMIANVNTTWKRRVGPPAFAASFFRQLGRFEFPPYQLTVEGVTTEAGSVVVSNASRYASNWIVAPDASLTSPDLHIRHVARRTGLWARAGAITLMGGRFGGKRGLTTQTARTLTIEGPVGDPVQADGDIVTTLPATVDIVPEALRLQFPV